MLIKKSMTLIMLCGIFMMMLHPAAVFAQGMGRGPRGGGMNGGQGGMNGQGGSPTVSEEDQKVIDEGASKFVQLTFTDPDTGKDLEYSLFIPENYDETQEYPLLMFIPDATASGKTASQIVSQYYGADIWVTEEEQAKHPSFVLVPAFSETVVDDNWNTSEQIETVVKLIDSLQEEYSIDKDRLYTTGQSMGCMTSLYLDAKYPDLFAAALFVSGQWDVSVLSPLEQAKFFYVTAGGDEKASGGQTEVMNMFETDGISFSYAEWSAQDSSEKQNDEVEALVSEKNNANFVRFTTGSVLSDGEGMEHMASFIFGYKLESVRDWLYQQTK